MKTFDFIIVGQGLAGTMLAWFLEQAGQGVLLIDNRHIGAASQVAAGVMNPITGRRFVKSWGYDTFFPFAKTTYQTIEKQLNIHAFYEMSIVRVLHQQSEANDWMLRTVLHDYSAYIDTANTKTWQNILPEYCSLAAIKQAARLDIPVLLSALAAKWREEGQLWEEKLDYDAIKINSTGVFYKNALARKMIFCEGQQARTNPYFRYLPFVPAKGEVLIIDIPSFPNTKMLKNGVYIVPVSKNRYWVGSTNTWTFDDDQPTATAKTNLLEKLDAAIDIPYSLLEHKAAIRPTVKDRRPFLGLHPQHPQLAIFNGLGTKGASLAPYWAAHFSDFLIHQQAIDLAVNITRFEGA